MSSLELIKSDALMCNWDPVSYFFISDSVEPLVYYSHLFPAIAILILATVVLYRGANKRASSQFFAIGIFFALFSVFDLILWATTNPSLIMFLWSILTYIEPLIYALTLTFTYSLVTGKSIPTLYKTIIAILFLPIIILGPTPLNLAGFNYTNCWRLAVEGPLATYYVYSIEAIMTIWILASSLLHFTKEQDRARKMRILYLLIGTILFLLAFSSGNIFGTLLQGIMGEEAWVIGQYGLFGMPLFLGFIMYMMVKFELFAARVVYAEVIILSLFVSLASLLFIPDMETARPVLIVTIGLFVILGYFLVSGIKRDIEQRKEIETLAQRLEKANKRLKVLDQMKSEFVSIASHQLRSPLTSIRGYSSMLLEGSFGKLPPKAQDAIGRINESSAMMAASVEDYLNVSRIQAGNMKYVYSDFNIADMASKIADDKRQEAVRKGLLLSYKSDLNGQGIVHADNGKTMQIIHNLINNSLKYTPKGTITVFVHDIKKQVSVDVIDTGIGMSAETIENIFAKFERAKNANEVNVTGTGLGLYVAQKMAQEMGGTIEAFSDGEGKGSTFRFTLPLQM